MRIALLVSVFVLTGCLEADKQSRRPLLNPATPEVTPETATGVRSQLHRTRQTAILSTAQEAAAATSLPAGYENVPNIFEADDGTGSGARSVIYAGHTGTTCGIGTNFTTIAARVQDCATINPNQANWNGQTNGNAGEGNWALVAKNTMGAEVWLDRTTGLLWSERLSEGTIWCEASGNTQGIADGGVVDCQVLNPNQRHACAELDILPANQASWRLPTRGDFLQADLNGARFVLRQNDLSFWTATVNGTNRDQAIAIELASGTLTSVSRAEGRAVRCIGRVLQ